MKYEIRQTNKITEIKFLNVMEIYSFSFCVQNVPEKPFSPKVNAVFPENRKLKMEKRKTKILTFKNFAFIKGDKRRFT